MTDRPLTDDEYTDVEKVLDAFEVPAMDVVISDDDVREIIRTLEETARLLRRAIAVETRVIEGPRPLPVPRSWAEIEALIKPIGLTAWPMFNGYARAAATADTLNTASNHYLFVRKAAGVALRMRDEFDVSSFPPPDEADFAKAWAVVLNGLILKPDYTDEERELVEHPFAESEEA